MQEEKNQPIARVCLGIDVGKEYLDVFLHPKAERFRFSNDKQGIDKLVKLCARSDVELIAMEATGKYHTRAHRMLHEADFKVAIINPYRSRKFADALGQLAKTDTIDAEVLARFAVMMQPAPTLPPAAHMKALRDLNIARRQVLQEIGDLTRQLETTDHPLVLKQMRFRIRLCERHKAVLESDIQSLVRSNADLKRRFEILVSIPGIGRVTATTLLTDMDELGQINAREIAALAGLAPMNRDSGIMRGARIIRGGRKHVRHLLYMCAISQTRRAGHLGQFYRRLVNEGKKPKIALVALARKMIILANTLIAEDRPWTPAAP
jgi:transposase